MAQNKSTAREGREARERLRRYKARQSVHSHRVARRQRDNVVAIAAVVIVATLATVAQVYYFSAGPGMPSPAPTTTPIATPTAPADQNTGNVPSPDVAENRAWTGTLTLGEDLALDIELDGQAAPQAVAAFVQQVRDDYFAGKTCHRLVNAPSSGLLQCGSLDGTGAGDPDFRFGPLENVPADGLYPAGTIALARGAEAYSQGHQFFIVFKDTVLPEDAAGGYTVFGSVTGGLDQLVSELGLDADSSVPQDGPPPAPITITAVTIE